MEHFAVATRSIGIFSVLYVSFLLLYILYWIYNIRLTSIEDVLSTGIIKPVKVTVL